MYLILTKPKAKNTSPIPISSSTLSTNPTNPSFSQKHSTQILIFMNPQNLSLNPNSIKYRFAKKFFRALERIRRQRRPATWSSCNNPREILQRYHRVKAAADKSLAFAAGSRRAWSRAMLCKIRSRRHGFVARRRIKINKESMSKDDAKENKKNDDQEVGFGQAKELRKLVPGGQAMDLCHLLEEAAHYIKCLNSQVQVMRSIADFYST